MSGEEVEFVLGSSKYDQVSFIYNKNFLFFYCSLSFLLKNLNFYVLTNFFFNYLELNRLPFLGDFDIFWT